MNSVASEIAAEPLLFSWDSPRRRRTMLAAFLVLSLMAHALCFYIFQIVYPTPVALLPPPARVTFIAWRPSKDRASAVLFPGKTNSQGTSTVEAGPKDSEFPATKCRTFYRPENGFHQRHP
jgi:hypothetical protein